MLRPEIPTLPPPAHLLEETGDQTGDQQAGEWRSVGRPSDPRPSAA